MTGPRVAIFDLDGTLLDSFEGITRCYRHAVVALERPAPTLDDLRPCIGMPMRDNFRRLLATDDPALVERAVAAFRARYDPVGWTEARVFPGVVEMLDALRAKDLRLHVATVKPQVFADRMISHFGLAERFDSVLGATLDGSLDEKARLLAHLLSRERLDPASACYVGDRALDVRAARSHGLLPVAVAWGYGPREELTSANPSHLCATPADVVRALAPEP
jgi:phosphoglycolate phosphatase